MERIIKEVVIQCGICVIMITWIVQLLDLARFDRIAFLLSLATLCVFIFFVLKPYYSKDLSQLTNFKEREK